MKTSNLNPSDSQQEISSKTCKNSLIIRIGLGLYAILLGAAFLLAIFNKIPRDWFKGFWYFTLLLVGGWVLAKSIKTRSFRTMGFFLVFLSSFELLEFMTFLSASEGSFCPWFSWKKLLAFSLFIGGMGMLLYPKKKVE